MPSSYKYRDPDFLYPLPKGTRETLRVLPDAPSREAFEAEPQFRRSGSYGRAVVRQKGAEIVAKVRAGATISSVAHDYGIARQAVSRLCRRAKARE